MSYTRIVGGSRVNLLRRYKMPMILPLSFATPDKKDPELT